MAADRPQPPQISHARAIPNPRRATILPRTFPRLRSGIAQWVDNQMRLAKPVSINNLRRAVRVLCVCFRGRWATRKVLHSHAAMLSPISFPRELIASRQRLSAFFAEQRWPSCSKAIGQEFSHFGSSTKNEGQGLPQPSAEECQIFRIPSGGEIRDREVQSQGKERAYK